MRFGVNPLHGVPVSYCLSDVPLILFSKVSSDSLISQSGSFSLPAVIGCTEIALLSQSTLTRRLQWIFYFRTRGQRNFLQGNSTIYQISKQKCLCISVVFSLFDDKITPQLQLFTFFIIAYTLVLDIIIIQFKAVFFPATKHDPKRPKYKGLFSMDYRQWWG